MNIWTCFSKKYTLSISILTRRPLSLRGCDGKTMAFLVGEGIVDTTGEKAGFTVVSDLRHVCAPGKAGLPLLVLKVGKSPKRQGKSPGYADVSAPRKEEGIPTVAINAGALPRSLLSCPRKTEEHLMSPFPSAFLCSPSPCILLFW